jgi:hypothetical protein
MSSRRSRWISIAVLALVGATLGTASLASSGSKPHGMRGVVTGAVHQQPGGEAGQESEGVHGGSIARFHGGSCQVPAGSDLQGNWTHGDYVTAWEKADETKVREAAHSPCGKPAHVAGRKPGQGPGKAAAAGKAERPRKVPAPEPQPPRST